MQTQVGTSNSQTQGVFIRREGLYAFYFKGIIYFERVWKAFVYEVGTPSRRQRSHPLILHGNKDYLAYLEK